MGDTFNRYFCGNGLSMLCDAAFVAALQLSFLPPRRKLKGTQSMEIFCPHGGDGLSRMHVLLYEGGLRIAFLLLHGGETVEVRVGGKLAHVPTRTVLYPWRQALLEWPYDRLDCTECNIWPKEIQNCFNQ